ncbi:adenylate kinase 7-like [Onthophagus taurus]|uniref:adenylate kinase 7-like n=1 Tax=Onthophagus taurus TaxID=166361 RepID=UPI000C20E4B4|nr:adenylate kinase 7-like [Onthophagus taurus]
MTTTDTEALSDICTELKSKYDGDPLFTDKSPPLSEGVIRHRVFMNLVDTYNAKHIASFLTDQVAGKIAAPGGEGEGEEGGGGGAEEQEIVAPKELPELVTGDKYEIIGTLQVPFHKKTEDILYTIEENNEDFYTEIMRCRTIIYNIGENGNEIPKALETLQKIVDEIEKVEDIGPKTFKAYSELRVFVLISTVMTWGNTKPIDPEDPETPFNESDFKKRKPHPNYLEHIGCEREVVLQGRKFPAKLKTYVICCGVIYGEQEEDLSFFFKLAFYNEEYMPILLPGNNRIPLIHIADLSKIVHGIIELIPKKQFILAVEQTPCTLKQIIKALSQTMGTGKVKEIPKEDAFLYADFTQDMFDKFTVNLTMEPGFIAEDMELEWKNEMNLAENMAAIVNEYKTSRKLVPIKILIHGPPAVGKTTLAEKLSEKYNVVHLTAKKVIDMTLKDLRDKITDEKERIKKKEEEAAAKGGGEGGDEDAEDAGEEQEEEEGEEVDLEAIQDQIREIETALNGTENGRLPDDMLIGLVKAQLKSNRCSNQGYVLDGFPKTMEQTKSLFGGGGGDGGGGEEEEAEEEDEEGGGGGGPKPTILPDFVITLYATDEFLCNRIMQLPERDIQDTHYTEEGMLRRLTDFHANNTEDNTMLNYFDEIEIHPLVVDAMKEPELNLEGEVEPIPTEILAKLGPPIKFEPTLQEEILINECVEKERQLKEEEERLKKELVEQHAYEEYQNKMEEWTSSMEKIQLEEERLIVAQCEPLRNYLVKFVFPTLTRGLMELAKLKPYDPVDFLAEYLFKENPEGHMFDPSYTREGEALDEVKESLSTTDSKSTTATNQQ